MLIQGSKEDPLEEGVATHSSILAWRISWAEEPGGLLSIGSQRVGHDWSDLACMYTYMAYLTQKISNKNKLKEKKICRLMSTYTQFWKQSSLLTSSQISLLQILIIHVNLVFQRHGWIKCYLSCWFIRRKGQLISMKTKLSVM